MTVAQRQEIARILARESAETLIGRTSGMRVELVRQLIRPLANSVARRFVAYDQMLGEAGPRYGASLIVSEVTSSLEVRGREHVPGSGPLLVVANHPGLSDAVALLTALGREDAWIVAANYPLLHALHRASRRFLFVPDRCAARLAASRRIISRLREGATVLLFPAGGLEVDPTLAPAVARASLRTWSRSTDLLARGARGVNVLPAVVSGAVSRSAFDHPLALRRRSPDERQRVASLLQVALPMYRTRVTVSFGAPIATKGTVDVHGAVIDAVGALMDAA